MHKLVVSGYRKTFTRFISYIPKCRLNGKVAIVTASTDGIGYAIAKRLGLEGAKLVISSRKEKNVDNAVKKLQEDNLEVIGCICHVGKKDDREKLYKAAKDRFGGIDILVSNAGINPSLGNVLDCDEEMWDKIFDINVKSAFLLAKEVLPFLRQRKRGSIVFVSSIGGYVPLHSLGAYSVSKTALLGLTKAAALQLACENINVNCVAPGIIQTKFSALLRTDENMNNHYMKIIPMQRFGKTEEVASVVAFLVSEDAQYITGEALIPAGGMTSRL